MRLFTAIELPDAVRAAVWAASEPLLASLPGARGVAEANLHVTVTFLGETSGAAVPRIAATLAAAAAQVVGGTVRVRGFGAFPSARAPRVVWAGVADPQRTLVALESAASRALAAIGIPSEGRRYTPHVTVARLADPRGRRGPHGPPPRRGAPGGAVAADTSARAPVPRFSPPPEIPLGPAFRLRELVLFASESGPGGAVRYRALDRFPLSAPTGT